MQDKKPASIRKPPIVQMVIWQLAITVIGFCLIRIFYEKAFSNAFFVGCFICIVPNAWFAWCAFRFQGASKTKEMIQSFYRGESGKIMLSAAMFALAFFFLDGINGLAVALGYGAAFVTGLLCFVKKTSH